MLTRKELSDELFRQSVQAARRCDIHEALELIAQSNYLLHITDQEYEAHYSPALLKAA